MLYRHGCGALRLLKQKMHTLDMLSSYRPIKKEYSKRGPRSYAMNMLISSSLTKKRKINIRVGPQITTQYDGSLLLQCKYETGKQLVSRVAIFLVK